MTKLECRVYAIPKPGGSKKAFYNKKLGRSIIVDDCKKNKEWRSDVKDAFIEKYHGMVPLSGPLFLKISFIMPRLKGHFNSKQILKPTAPNFHTVKPDSTKLTRSTEDALTGLAWRDDSQICIQEISKEYGDNPGAIITIETMRDETCQS